MFLKYSILQNKNLYRLLTVFIAIVWFVNGFFCKILNLVPRHEQIVSTILHQEFSRYITILIGFLEVVMSFWVLANYKTKFNAITQILVIATMNILEFFLVSDILLWGEFNSVFAFCFILIIYFKEFVLYKKIKPLH